VIVSGLGNPVGIIEDAHEGGVGRDVAMRQRQAGAADRGFRIEAIEPAGKIVRDVDGRAARGSRGSLRASVGADSLARRVIALERFVDRRHR